MKVKELINQLQKFDPEKEVVVMGNNMTSTCNIDEILEITKSLNQTTYGYSNNDIGKIIISND